MNCHIFTEKNATKLVLVLTQTLLITAYVHSKLDSNFFAALTIKLL